LPISKSLAPFVVAFPTKQERKTGQDQERTLPERGRRRLQLAWKGLGDLGSKWIPGVGASFLRTKEKRKSQTEVSQIQMKSNGVADVPPENNKGKYQEVEEEEE